MVLVNADVVQPTYKKHNSKCIEIKPRQILMIVCENQ